MGVSGTLLFVSLLGCLKYTFYFSGCLFVSDSEYLSLLGKLCTLCNSTRFLSVVSYYMLHSKPPEKFSIFSLMLKKMVPCFISYTNCCFKQRDEYRHPKVSKSSFFPTRHKNFEETSLFQFFRGGGRCEW